MPFPLPLNQYFPRMPDIHQQQRKKHRHCIEDVCEELVVVDIGVQRAAERGGEFDNSEDNAELNLQRQPDNPRTESLTTR
jgi:hypothetical protein